MLKPTRNRFSLRNSHHSSLISVPLVCRSFSIFWTGFAYFFSSATTLRKKSRPINVGSPPCQENTTSGPVTPAMYCWMNRSSISSDIRPGGRAVGQGFLAQVKTVVAIEVAGGTAGLDHDMEPLPRLVPEQGRRVVFVHGVASGWWRVAGGGWHTHLGKLEAGRHRCGLDSGCIHFAAGSFPAGSRILNAAKAEMIAAGVNVSFAARAHHVTGAILVGAKERAAALHPLGLVIAGIVAGGRASRDCAPRHRPPASLSRA